MASPYDLVIRGGTVYDGTGAPGARADVGVRGDRITGVGTIAERGGAELDAAGLAVSPGFIDVHSHDDLAVLCDPQMAFKVLGCPRRGASRTRVGTAASRGCWATMSATSGCWSWPRPSTG